MSSAVFPSCYAWNRSSSPQSSLVYSAIMGGLVSWVSQKMDLTWTSLQFSLSAFTPACSKFKLFLGRGEEMSNLEEKGRKHINFHFRDYMIFDSLLRLSDSWLIQFEAYKITFSHALKGKLASCGRHTCVETHIKTQTCDVSESWLVGWCGPSSRRILPALCAASKKKKWIQFQRHYWRKCTTVLHITGLSVSFSLLQR